jgi:chemotaxis protein CheD
LNAAATAGAQVLHPGDVACVDAGERLETLLGSCVAVVLTDPRRTVGAMCHIVHAQPCGSRGVVDPRHADAAFDTMYAMLRARAIEPRLCEAYVYGGGNMFPGLIRTATHVGERNVRAVLARLEADGVAIAWIDVGGAAYRRLRWTVGPRDPEVAAVPV